MSGETYDILSMNFEEVSEIIASLNAPKYRAKQVFEWLHHRGATSFNEMDNLPKDLRTKLVQHCYIASCKLADTKTSKDDNTCKFLFELSDGVLIESVLMEYSYGYSICISTQAGCRMGCKFCASTQGGLIRNLTAGEMCAQVYALRKHKATTDKLGGIVLMGCGEPLDNFDATIRFLELIDVGARNITLSTCGLVPEIKKLADIKLQINLAVSLHAPDDEIRSQIMPIAKKHPIEELVQACKYYVDKTNRRITFEYSLINGLNDEANHANRLAKLLAVIPTALCHVNLIPVNPDGTGKFTPTLRKGAEAFAAVLQKKHTNTTIRRTIGSDVDAACGQLRAKRINEG